MTRLELDPARVAAEMAEFSSRFAQAALQLSTMDVRGEGCSVRVEAFRIEKTVLWRYARTAQDAGLPPLVISYALVNRPYMLDLQPDRSLIRGLLARGLDVYLVDWGYPDDDDRGLCLDDYVNRYLGACIDHVRRAHGVPSVNLLGVCQGGTMALCHAAQNPERVRNLVTMVTPVDFHTDDNLLAKWARKLDAARLVEALGNVPGQLLNAAFIALMPLRLTARKYAGLADIAGDRAALENFLRMERWIHDSPDQAGAAFVEFIRWFFQENRLMRSGLEIGGRPVDPRAITCPILNVYAAQDHLVPPSASRPLESLTGSGDYSAFEFDGGHIGIYVSRSAQELLPRAIAEWLGSR
ncbi:MAG TPA: class III poly(R)-hydroxyalkanoic acid synthase subunit PhaC [Steroidobacteraceae bacterium]|nr:class III poly(R)-hydroxyalkanoic acid synthase subunit PhaC [Steroidobacteraceae bacterium]